VAWRIENVLTMRDLAIDIGDSLMDGEGVVDRAGSPLPVPVFLPEDRSRVGSGG